MSIQISPNVLLNISSLSHHLRLIEAGLFFCYLTFNFQTCAAVQVYVVCCFPGCRETHYQTADQKRSIGHTYLNKLYLIYLVSCSSYLIYKIFMPLHSALSFLFPSFVAPLPGLDTVAGRLQECDTLSQMSGSVSVLPTSITKQLRSLYNHQLPRRSLLLDCYCLETTSSPSLTEQGPSKSDPSSCGHFSLHNS